MPTAEVPQSRPPRRRPVVTTGPIELRGLYPETIAWMAREIPDRETAVRILNETASGQDPLRTLGAQVWLASRRDLVKSRGGNGFATALLLVVAIVLAALAIGWCLR